VRSFGWDLDSWERDGKWTFVDASPEQEEYVVAGSYDFGALLARVEFAAGKIGALRLSMDSLGALFARFCDSGTVRHELFRIAAALKKMGVTAVLTAERTEEYDSISNYGVEEFVADNVVILRNALDDEKRRRTIEILKVRGAPHQKGEFPFAIVPGDGIAVLPLSALELKQKSSDVRVTSGNAELDTMCGGGFFRDSIILVSGATGTGKTLLATEFCAGGVRNGERALMLSFEESREQIIRNAKGCGVDFGRMEEEGNLRIVCRYPEVSGLEDHLIMIRNAVEEFAPHRITVDSLSALERVGTERGYREFVIGMISFIKHREIAGLCTAATPTLLGGESMAAVEISSLTDLIILLRYVEMYGEMRRGLTVLKMRGSGHDKDIREFTIDGRGMRIGRPFHRVAGILSGSPRYVPPSEIERLGEMFDQEER
jgi:circadian clock protein KaiC